MRSVVRTESLGKADDGFEVVMVLYIYMNGGKVEEIPDEGWKGNTLLCGASM